MARRGATHVAPPGDFSLPHPGDTGVGECQDRRVACAAMNADVEGKVYPTSTVTIEPDAVRAFADVLGQSAPGVPPTFLTVAEFGVFGDVIADPELDLDFARVVHGEQEYVWHRPLEPGERLVVEPRIASIRERGGHGFLTIEVGVRSAEGEPVATTRATMVERAAP